MLMPRIENPWVDLLHTSEELLVLPLWSYTLVIPLSCPGTVFMRMLEATSGLGLRHRPQKSGGECSGRTKG
jgi:hypothetical protein